MLLCEASSSLRTASVGSLLRPLLDRYSASSVFIDPFSVSTAESLHSFLSALDQKPLVLGEVPPGKGRDPRLLLALGTGLGSADRSALLLGPEVGHDEEELVSLLHAAALQFRDTTALSQGLAYFLEQAWSEGGAATRTPEDGWKDWRVAQGLLSRGTLLGRAGLLGEEVKVYRELLERFAPRTEPPFQETTLRARINLASSYRLLGQHEDALREYREAAAQGLRLQGTVGEEGAVRALVLGGELLSERSRASEALRLFDQALGILKSDESTDLEEWRARGLLDRGLALSALSRFPEALATFGNVVERFGSRPARKLDAEVAKAMLNRAITFRELWERGKALSEYDQLIARFETADDPEVFEQVVKARINRGLLLGELGRREEEIDQYNEVVQILEGSADATMRPWIAWALLNKGVALGQRRKYRDEVAAYAEVVRRFENFPEPGLRVPVARALVNEGLALMRLGQDEEAAFAFDQVLQRFSDSREPSLQQLVASARENRARLPEPSW